ncbi:hypothetical protein BD289DRAFT_430124 [Coniella lustricola]|uniref:Uncharacterized protein n=1 Tax=Coniella lustricola TaxID=2025994 RepID=A0A2T3ACF9_9PEZI|nr:hypothetical protein BD289DRAFT_430124 [Coniella lustricola]
MMMVIPQIHSPVTVTFSIPSHTTWRVPDSDTSTTPEPAINRCHSLQLPNELSCGTKSASRSQTFAGFICTSKRSHHYLQQQQQQQQHCQVLSHSPIARKFSTVFCYKMNPHHGQYASSTRSISHNGGYHHLESTPSATQPQESGYKCPNTLIVSGYTCIGKTTFQRNDALRHRLLDCSSNVPVQVIDMDSSTYSRDNFPANYLAAIRHQAEGNDDSCGQEPPRILLISTFPGVATQLKSEGFYVAQVYPDKSAETKRKWLRRLAEREEQHSESRLYRLVHAMWDQWFEEMETRDVSFSVKVGAGSYLSTVIGDIYEAFRRTKLEQASRKGFYGHERDKKLGDE